MVFPLHRPLTPASRITVRPWTRRRWPTVVSEHELQGATFRLKQFVLGWGASQFPPLLWPLAGGASGEPDRMYAPTTVFHQPGLIAAHGRHWDGREGGHALAHMTALDVAVTDGRLGAEGLRAFLGGLRWADAHSSLARHRRPLFEWCWSLKEQRNQSSPRTTRWPVRLRWSGSRRSVPLGSGRWIDPPNVPGLSLDCVGASRTRQGGPNEVDLYYRSRDGPAPVVVSYKAGIPPPVPRLGPVYRLLRTQVEGFPATAIRVPIAGSSQVVVELGDDIRLALGVPALVGPDRGNLDLDLAASMVRATRLPV